MPIRPENQSRYPDEWPMISARIRARAKQRCERCGLPNYAVGYRERDGTFVRAAGNGPQDAAGQGCVWPSMDPISYQAAREIAELNNEGADRDLEVHRWIVIVLTVAHLDNHDPADCRDENLAALCQRCHNRHDVRHRRAGIRERRHAGQGDLFSRVEVPA